jgi:hypothetical protein
MSRLSVLPHLAAALMAVAAVPALASANLLSNAGFESAAPLLQLPSTTGVWSGDLCARVPAENGITPAEGSSMLRFVAAFWTCPTGGRGSDLWQLVPVDPGAATATLSGLCNRVAGDSQTDTEFDISIRAYSGSPAGFDDLSPSLPAPLASTTVTINSDGNASTWEPMSVQLSLPPGTQYLAVLVSAVENVFDDTGCPPDEFDGQYVDDLRLTVTESVPGFPRQAIGLLALLLAASAWFALRGHRRGFHRAD